METVPPPTPSTGAPGLLRANLLTAARYWEPRRIGYNAVLSAVAITWIIATWPHFRPALTLNSLPPLIVLAVLANVCYCAAYFVDVPMQMSVFVEPWLRYRWALWLLGVVLAVLLEWYWIGDEIYPDFH